MRSPAAAFHVPLITQEKITRANGKYGAEIVNRPKSDIGVDECRRDHMYMGTKASEEERKGRLNKGDMAYTTKHEIQATENPRNLPRASQMTEEAAKSNRPFCWQKMILLTSDYIAC